MSHKYLTELNIDENDVMSSFAHIPTEEENDEKPDPREERWERQRAEYGFDDRETWDLDWFFYAWLYEHLRMYEDIGGKTVDLDHHTFIYNNKKYTQKEMIKEIERRIKFFFASYDEWDTNSEEQEYIKGIGEMWAIILPAMWW